jgi:hypothetical protein
VRCDWIAKEGAMRAKKSRVGLENLESRALLTSSVGFGDFPTTVVSDRVGMVDVHVNMATVVGTESSATPVTLTRTTGGGTAVPGVDYTPVQQTITLTPNTSSDPMSADPMVTVRVPILPGSPSMGTRVLPVTLSPTPGNPQGQTEYIVITHGGDTTPPTVLNAQALTLGGKVVAFSIQFSKPMDPATVANLANYAAAAPKSALEAGASLMGTSSSVSYSKSIPLKSVVYDATSNTAYLIPVSPTKPNNRIRRPFEFQVGSPAPTTFSNLRDTSGNPINSLAVTGLVDTAGSFVQQAMVTKASPTVLAFLHLGGPTPTRHRASHKVR